MIFHVSIDDLFGYDYQDEDQKVESICEEVWKIRKTNPKAGEKILRDALQIYPGNPILLNNLLYTIRFSDRDYEVIDLCHSLIVNNNNQDDIKYDAIRILAETYHELGEIRLVEETLEKLPELYFTKTELEAELLDGPKGIDASCRMSHLALDTFIHMQFRLLHLYEEANNVKALRDTLNCIVKIYPLIKDRMAPQFDAEGSYKDLFSEELNHYLSKYEEKKL